MSSTGQLRRLIQTSHPTAAESLRSPLTKHTILFLAANPLGTDRLAASREAQALQEALQRSSQGHKFEFVTWWAVQPKDLLSELRRLKPTLVHFSGHGGRHKLATASSARRDVVTELGAADGSVAGGEYVHGLFFEEPDGRPQFVSATALREMFGAAGASVRLVMLNAGYSEVQAEALLVHVDCAVGFRGPSRHDAARCFMIGFYGALAEGRSIADSYRQSCAAMRLEGWRDGDQPRLMVRKEVDAERLMLVGGFDNEPAAAIELRDVRVKEDPSNSGQECGRTLIAVIGIDRYQHTRHWRALSNAVSDARGAAALFAQLGFVQATEALIDDAATGRAIQSMVTDDLMVLRPDDSLVLFYAGHGGNRKHRVGGHEVTTGYLIPVDAEDKVSTWVDLEAWLRSVALLPPRHILVILDACHSGIALDPVIKWRGSTSWRSEPLATLKSRHSRRIITSALGDQRALDGGPCPGHSLFTGCLIEALTNARRGDDGIMTGSELGLYLQRRVQSYPHSQQQTPDFGTFAFDERGELVIPLGPDPLQRLASSQRQEVETGDTLNGESVRYRLAYGDVELSIVVNDDETAGGLLLWRRVGIEAWTARSLAPLEFQLLRALCIRAHDEAGSPSQVRGCVPTKQLLIKLPFQRKYANEENVLEVVRRLRGVLAEVGVRSVLAEIGAQGVFDVAPGRGYYLMCDVTVVGTPDLVRHGTAS
jgi:hypothetical protein